MKAIKFCEYGPPDVLRVEEIEKPTPKNNELLVRVRSASLNFIDAGLVRGPSVLRLEGKVTPFIEKIYSLDQTANALRYFEEGHARGKLVIKIAAVATSAGELTSDEYGQATGLWATMTVHSLSLTREVNHYR